MKSSLTRIAGVAVLLLLAGYAFIALQGQQGLPGLMEKRRQIREYEKRYPSPVPPDNQPDR